MSGTWLGVVADDLTGACDLADAVCAAGRSAVVTFGVPTGAEPPDADCAVVGLTSRTAPVEEAVAASVAAARWLRTAGCRILYQKYCSTFDSTDAGNIGPVADALRALVGPGAAAVGTPATPRVGRTVYQGHLFVGPRLLSESPLRDHPSTPMRDPDLVRVLGRQTAAPVALVDHATVRGGAGEVSRAVAAAVAGGAGHVLLDALDDADLDVLARGLLAADVPPLLLGGAAGLAGALARVDAAAFGTSAPHMALMCQNRIDAGAGRDVRPVPVGHRLVLSGSCSERTREQVAAFPGPRLQLDPLEVAADPAGTVEATVAELAALLDGADGPVLVCSSAGPDDVREVERRLGPGRAARLLESATAAVAAAAVDTLGVRRVLVAGGETSGAVVRALGIGALRIGPAVAPGLPWTVPVDGPPLALLLKSGNFGPPDLFTTAWESCP